MWKDVVQGCQKAFMHQSDVSIGQSHGNSLNIRIHMPVLSRFELCAAEGHDGQFPATGFEDTRVDVLSIFIQHVHIPIINGRADVGPPLQQPRADLHVHLVVAHMRILHRWPQTRAVLDRRLQNISGPFGANALGLAIHHADGGSPGGPREMNPRVPSHLRLATLDPTRGAVAQMFTFRKLEGPAQGVVSTAARRCTRTLRKDPWYGALELEGIGVTKDLLIG
mmetsp:Transcript_50232/g.109344  ORF Transcript_50232/g.109344 Transcript_50232/m.109344 type:complete len:223 (-) Transcript_50232:315-983(-)